MCCFGGMHVPAHVYSGSSSTIENTDIAANQKHQSPRKFCKLFRIGAATRLRRNDVYFVDIGECKCVPHARPKGEHMPQRDARTSVAHLFRRAGFGLRPEALDHFTSLGIRGSVEYLINYDAVADPAETR